MGAKFPQYPPADKVKPKQLPPPPPPMKPESIPNKHQLDYAIAKFEHAGPLCRVFAEALRKIRDETR